MTLNQKNHEVLEAHIKIIEKEPRKHNFGILKELAQESQAASKADDEKPAKLEVSDKDQSLFFGEFSDEGAQTVKKEDENQSTGDSERMAGEASDGGKLIDYERDFDEFMASSSILLPSQLLMDDALFNDPSIDASMDLLGSLVPSQADSGQSSNDLTSASKENSVQMNKNPSKKASDVSKWFSLFSELDPLNQQSEQDDASKNFHAA